MDVHTALAGVVGYSHLLDKTQAAQQHLWSVARNPPPEFPLGLRTRVSGSGRSLPVVPWIALLDEAVTKTATDGLYLVYLYTKTLDTVYLSMNQGATQHRQAAEESGHRGRGADTAALAKIASVTASIRAGLHASLLARTLPSIELGATHFLPVAYEMGSIAAVEYSIANLPGAATLAADLSEFAAIYARCVEINDALAANGQISSSARSLERRRVTPQPESEFKPKDSSDYVANVQASRQRRERKHEALIAEFGKAVLARGYSPHLKVHPRDLVVLDASQEWLVEAKTVGLNAEPAVREAIGQLLAYRHFYYRVPGIPDPRLLALFNAPIGTEFERLLASLDIEVVYRSGGGWRGSADGLALVPAEL